MGVNNGVKSVRGVNRGYFKTLCCKNAHVMCLNLCIKNLLHSNLYSITVTLYAAIPMYCIMLSSPYKLNVMYCYRYRVMQSYI